MPKEIEKIIIRYMESLFSKNSNKVIEFDFQDIEGVLFLFVQMDNGNFKKKNNLHLDMSDLAELYTLLYQECKDKYLNVMGRYINLYEETDLSDPDRSYLNIVVRDVHKNVIRLEFKDHNSNQVSEVLKMIKNDWIELVKKNKESKNK